MFSHFIKYEINIISLKNSNMLYLIEEKKKTNMYMANIFIPAVPPDGFYHIAFPLTQAN